MQIDDTQSKATIASLRPFKSHSKTLSCILTDTDTIVRSDSFRRSIVAAGLRFTDETEELRYELCCND